MALGEKKNFALIFSIIAAALGSGFQHGFNTGVMNNPQKVIEKWVNGSFKARGGEINYKEVQEIFSVISAIYCGGGMIGALLIGIIADLLGRKWSIMLNNIFVVIPAIMIFFCKDLNLWELLIAARFILGLNSGFNSGVCPLYLNEISPIASRGAIGSIYQLVITISILIAQCLGYKSVLGSDSMWHILLCFCLVGTIFQLLTMPFCPETPRYSLINKKDPEKATKNLKWLRGKDDVQDDIDEMTKEAEAQEAAGSAPWKHLVTKKFLRKPLIISLVIMLAQQLCGINAIIFYSNQIFILAGMSEEGAAIGTIIMGIVNVLMTIVSVSLVDLAGRKTLLLIGFSGTTIFTTLLMFGIFFSSESQIISIFCIIFVLGYIISFATGPGSIPWFLVTELFRQDARPKATSLAVFANWFANLLVVLSFLPIKNLIGYWVFLIFIILQILFVAFIFFEVPETKNRSIDEIVESFGGE